MTDPRRTRLEQQRDQALADLRDLEAQVSSGEIDASVALGLRSRYEVEALDAMQAIDRLEPAISEPGSRRRVLIGAGAFIAVATVVTITLVSAVEPRPDGGYVTGGVAAEVVEEAPVDLSSITNEEMEQVVAANPEILPMRLALARRYVEAGDFSTALPHYMFVLDRETDPEALMYVGWMTYVSGDAVTGAALLRESLAILPGDTLAQWFLANALFDGTGETTEAILLLKAVIDSDRAPDEIVAQAQRMLNEASG
ncbi:MAG: tetratricopeptide repeat protein [Acidobacteria bacterium]|nr:tetratricopeptide repeat protein [Acidobacteriota bacterium]